MNTMYVPLRKSSEDYYLRKTYSKFLKELGISLIGLFPNCLYNYLELMESSIGLLLPGGGDINPLRYGEDRKNEYDIEMDGFEERLYVATRKMGKKILGICRGLQVINVFEGGTLKRVEGHENTTHLVTYKGQSHLVNSFHHEAIDKLAPSLNVLATTQDGIIEALSSKDQKTLAFQFHIERTSKDERDYWLKELKAFF